MCQSTASKYRVIGLKVRGTGGRKRDHRIPGHRKNLCFALGEMRKLFLRTIVATMRTECKMLEMLIYKPLNSLEQQAR
jgi:hypothetical protein